jgi:hypothetical protein
MIIVGSKALKFHFPKLKREVKDIDIIGYSDDVNTLCDLLSPTEIKKGKHTVLLKNITNKTDTFNTNNVEVLLADDSVSLRRYMHYDDVSLFASPEVLFSLKKSHINFPIKFEKHIEDYSFLYNHFDGVDFLYDITEINFKETEDRFGKLKTPSLNKTVKEFFGQSKGYVESYFIHDDIHRVMAHYDKPLYEMMRVDKNLAKCEKDMWNLFTFEDKCKCVLEEAYVISLERKIIPMLFGGGRGYTSEGALDWALMRVCTTLCSGWFRKFATNNYYDIKKLVNKNYVEKFLTEYENGNITRQPSN